MIQHPVPTSSNWRFVRIALLRFVGLGVGIGIGGGAGFGCYSTVMAIGEGADRAEWVKTQQAPVELSGTVRDESGTAVLRDVLVRIERTYLSGVSKPIPDERIERGHRSIQGAFHFKWPVAKQVRLVFEKPGYDPAELVVAVRNTVAADERGRPGPPAQAIAQANLVVTLRKRN